MKNNETLKEGLAAHNDVIYAISNDINATIQKQAEEQSEKAKEEAAIAKADDSNSQKATKNQLPNQKNMYFGKLDGIEISLSDLEYLYSKGTTAEMIQAEAEVYKRWDDALNEIYGVLKSQLLKSEMNRLRDKQREWILYRDHEAEKVA